jgi:Holliday junction resolvasome RuvABC ATP-dependent DNA helicase subunit
MLENIYIIFMVFKSLGFLCESKAVSTIKIKTTTFLLPTATTTFGYLMQQLLEGTFKILTKFNK